SMANTYMLMGEYQMDKLNGFRKYLKGRIAANPFFGYEVKFTTLNFLDKVLIPYKLNIPEKIFFNSTRKLVAPQSKLFNREASIKLMTYLVSKDNIITERMWTEIKRKTLSVINGLDSVPVINKLPLQTTILKLPMKLFAIQVQSALRESKTIDK